ncbi:hypothetical protein VP01_1037g7 [Puccinia sorghi]|uniref:histone acetyltransferase n=1 Tax=Puccinia sorghi TaxID=27349 RepID=A0A0L6VUK0_9BASI|nr:hypothetical protein VP01_1037g7 [Puccinia sorghi]
MAPRPSLHQSLYNALQSVPTDKANPRTFELLTLSTKPFRTYTLFPHALDPTVSIMRTDYLIMLAEKFRDYRPNSTPPSDLTVPVFALEASLYTISTTSAQLLYVSKIDTTGLAPTPAPAGRLTIAFLSHFLEYPPKSTHSLRIHIFARAAREGQYLFPASAENRPNGTGDGAKFAPKNSLAAPQDPATSPLNSKLPAGKRILDDQQLVKWWHRILSQLVTELPQVSEFKKSLELFYILPGFDYQESLQVLPVSSEFKSLWNYGHPYHKIPPPFAPAQENSTNLDVDRQRGWLLSELIPAFNDDPKARFLHSIGNCSTNPSGEPGDWDDAITERSPASLESDRNRERTKINQVSPEEFWDRMGGRQECCDGRLSAFFVVCSSISYFTSTSFNSRSKNPPSHLSSVQEDLQITSSSCSISAKPTSHTDSNKVQKHLVGVPRNVWVSLWSKIHNKDYSSLEASAAGYSVWIEDVRSSINSAILEEKQKRKRKLEEKRSQLEPDERAVSSEPDHKNPTQPAEPKRESWGSFEDCYSVVFVDNALKVPLDPYHHSDLLEAGSNSGKRPQVHVLQPRKKTKS